MMKRETGAERLQRATDLGFAAGMRGDPSESNPYEAGIDERLARYWAEGHARGAGAMQVAIAWPLLRRSQAKQAA